MAADNNIADKLYHLILVSPVAGYTGEHFMWQDGAFNGGRFCANVISGQEGTDFGLYYWAYVFNVKKIKTINGEAFYNIVSKRSGKTMTVDPKTATAGAWAEGEPIKAKNSKKPNMTQLWKFNDTGTTFTFENASYKVYNIISDTGKTLLAHTYNNNPATTLMAGINVGGSLNKWILVPFNTFRYNDYGLYGFMSYDNQALNLGIVGNSGSVGAKVNCTKYNINANHQKFILDKISGNNFYIKNTRSGLYLKAQTSGTTKYITQEKLIEGNQAFIFNISVLGYYTNADMEYSPFPLVVIKDTVNSLAFYYDQNPSGLVTLKAYDYNTPKRFQFALYPETIIRSDIPLPYDLCVYADASGTDPQNGIFIDNTRVKSVNVANQGEEYVPYPYRVWPTFAAPVNWVNVENNHYEIGRRVRYLDLNGSWSAWSSWWEFVTTNLYNERGKVDSNNNSMPILWADNTDYVGMDSLLANKVFGKTVRFPYFSEVADVPANTILTTRMQFQYRIRPVRAGDGGESGLFAGDIVTSDVINLYFKPTLSIGSVIEKDENDVPQIVTADVYFDYEGIHIPYVSDLMDKGGLDFKLGRLALNVCEYDGDSWWGGRVGSLNVYDQPSTGELILPLEYYYWPVDGSKFELDYQLSVTSYNLSKKETFNRTPGIVYGPNNTLTPDMLVSSYPGARIKVAVPYVESNRLFVAFDDGPGTRYPMEIFNKSETSETSEFIIEYPFYKDFSIYVMSKDSSENWGFDYAHIPQSSSLVHSPCHAFTWDGGSFLLECDEDEYLKVPHDLTRNHSVYRLLNREYESVILEPGFSSRLNSVTGFLASGVTENTTEDIKALLEQGHVRYRPPIKSDKNSILTVAIVEASWEDSYRGTFNGQDVFGAQVTLTIIEESV